MQPAKTNILLLLNNISRSSGGMSSALDLAETLYRLSYEVNICLTSSKFIYALIGSRKLKTIVPLANICTIPREFKRIKKGKPLEGTVVEINKGEFIKSVIKLILSKIFDRSNKFYKLLSAANIIIDTADFSGEGFAAIRANTKACIIRNHPGSPTVFEEYWLTDEHLLEPAVSKESRYIEFCRLYDAILFQAADQANACIKRDADLKSRCYAVSPSCQEHKVLAAGQLERPYPNGRRAIVIVGSIQPRKAQHIAIKAFSLIADKHQCVDLHLVGGGNDSEYGKSLISEVEKAVLSDRVFFHGYRQDYLRYMVHAEFVLQTSENEGVSRILREAMLMKKPIVSFAISGTTSLLKAGEDAVLVKNKDIGELADAMNYCLDNPAYASELAESAYRRYLLNNSWAAYATNLMELVNSLLGKEKS